jgi:hypothetical protein
MCFITNPRHKCSYTRQIYVIWCSYLPFISSSCNIEYNPKAFNERKQSFVSISNYLTQRQCQYFGGWLFLHLQIKQYVYTAKQILFLIKYEVFTAVILCILLRCPKNEGNIFLLNTALSYKITRWQNSESDSAVYTLRNLCNFYLIFSTCINFSSLCSLLFLLKLLFNGTSLSLQLARYCIATDE